MSSKQREALLAVCDCAKDGVLAVRESAFEKVLEALKEPVLNGEVGTAEEQYARFKKWCEGEFYKRPMNALTGEPCKSCPCYSVSASGVDGCNYLRWAQMPYEEVTNDATRT